MPGPQRGAVEKPKNLSVALRKFVKSLADWKVYILLAMIAAMVSVVASLFGPRILGNMTTEATRGFMSGEGIDWGIINGLAWGLIGLYILSAFFSFLEGFIFSRVSARFAAKMRTQLIEKISRLPISYFDKHQYGDTLSRMSNDVSMISDTLANVLSQIIAAIVTLVGIIIIMFTISPILALVAMIVVPVSIFLVSFIAQKAQKYFKEQQSTLGNLNNIIEEDYSGQTIIKANSHDLESVEAFSKVNSRLYNNAWKAQFFSSIAYPIVNICTNLSYIVICVLGGQFAVSGRMSIGDIQAFIQYVQQFNRPITSISQITASIQQALAASERVFDFLEEAEEASDPLTTAEIAELEKNNQLPKDTVLAQNIKDFKGEVEFDGVYFGYSKDNEFIRNISVKIDPGMHVAIVGPTGAGKTTLINLLMRFYDPTRGEIKIDGVATTSMKRADVRKMFGMVLQDTWLFKGSVIDNLRYGNQEATKEQVIEAAKATNIHHFIESLPKGYDTEINEDSDDISAGEKQLLTITRALIANQPMMILDEATSNVDTRTEQIIQDAFTKLSKGRTTFVIAHRLSTIRDSDLILVVRDGKIAEQGKHDELLKLNGFYAELYNSQFEEKEA